MGKDSLLIWLLISLSPFLCSSSSKANSSKVTYSCGNESTYNASSMFHNNLDRLLHTGLDIEDGISGFNSSSVGEPLDEAYGLFLCRPDMGLSDCQSCIDDASSQMIGGCSGRKNAIILNYECLLIRYPEQNFSAIVNGSVVAVITTQRPADKEILQEEFTADTFQHFVDNMVSHFSNMVNQAANLKLVSSSGTLSITCIPGLASLDYCSSCLTYAFYQMGMENSVQAEIHLPSCGIEYEIHQDRGQEPAHQPGDGPSNNRTITTDHRSQWIIIVSSTVGAVCLVVSLGSYFINALRKRNLKKERSSNSHEFQLRDLKREVIPDEFPYDYFHEEKPVNSHDLPLMTLEVISAATNNFSFKNKLGQGGFGPVYKGILGDGKEIAVKRLSGTSGQGLSELRTEVTLIARLQHRNLVRLLGCCLENNEKLLIYEYMPNKSLDVFLFGSNTGTILDWENRVNIIDGIARGLLYLHEDSRLRIVHRDLKASNILLDHDMNPKISDFGMARIVGGNQTSDTTNRIVGTYGYMAPEYAMGGLFSVKSDVFSFGVLLLELLSGKRNNGFHLHQHGESLLTYAWRLWGEGRGLELIDQRIRESFNVVQALKCIHIGLSCVQEEPADRPNMLVVVLMLRGDTVSLLQPAKPAFSVGRHTVASDAPLSDKYFPSVNGLTISSMSPR